MLIVASSGSLLIQKKKKKHLFFFGWEEYTLSPQTRAGNFNTTRESDTNMTREKIGFGLALSGSGLNRVYPVNFVSGRSTRRVWWVDLLDLINVRFWQVPTRPRPGYCLGLAGTY